MTRLEKRGPAAARATLAGAVSIATVIVIVGLTIAVFFNPLWISFEQDRAGVPAITEYTPQQVTEATGSILADLFLGPPDFDVTVDGQPVLDAAERSHMLDVRFVLLAFVVVFLIAAAVLVAIVARNRRSARVWRAVARGSGALVIVGVAIGVAVLFFFDAAFLLFHLVFFPQGNFSFDPKTQRLTQLFPDAFWSETSIAIAVVGLAIALAVTTGARLVASRLALDPGRGGVPAPPTPTIAVLEGEAADHAS